MTHSTEHDPIGAATDEIRDARPAPDGPFGDAAPADPAAIHPPTALSRLGEAVISGLVHCACVHHQLHPDLVTLASGEAPASPTAAAAEETTPDGV